MLSENGARMDERTWDLQSPAPYPLMLRQRQLERERRSRAMRRQMALMGRPVDIGHPIVRWSFVVSLGLLGGICLVCVVVILAT